MMCRNDISLEAGHVHDADIILKDVCASKGDTEVGADVFHDIEMFVDYNGNKENTVLKTFKPHLNGSYILLEKILSEPFGSPSHIETRQNIIKYYADKIETYAPALKQLSDLENDVLWIFEEKDETLKDVYNIVYFKWFFTRRLNDYPMALTSAVFYKIAISPLFGLLTPIVYFLIPYIIIRFKFKIQISFVAYLKFSLHALMNDEMMNMSGRGYKWMNKISMIMSLVFYFQGIFGSIDLSQTYYKISKHLTEKINKVVEFVTIGQEVVNGLWHEDIKNIFPEMSVRSPFSFNFTAKKYNVFSNFGRQLAAFKKLDMSELRRFVQQIYIVDTIHSIASYKDNMKGSFAQYSDTIEPMIDMSDLWHPCINPTKAIRNCLVTDPLKRNVIITGPNAGGKSTFIKSLLINIVLAQTLGISICSHLTFTPFHNIRSQINIPDSKGHESLFEAEMYRCKHNLDLIKSQPQQRILLVMDEIFNSTNPVEGIAGAFAIADRLGRHGNALVFFTTHYTYLTKLEKQSMFRNYKMNVVKSDGAIQYPYKLERGISKQYIALELLKLNGFDNDLIEHALVIKDKFAPRV